MSTLEISLVVLVVVTLGGVVLSNVLQMRKARERLRPTENAGEGFPEGRAVPGVTGFAAGPMGGRVEPVLTDPDAIASPDDVGEGAHDREEAAAMARPASTGPAVARAAGHSAGATVAPTDTAASVEAARRGVDAPAPHPAPAAAPARPPVLDELADCIVVLPVPGSLPPERLSALLQGIRRAGSKPIVIESDDGGDGQWQPYAGLRTPRRLRLGVLLANRHGPLNAMEFSEFVAAVEGLAGQLGVPVSAPEMTRVLDRARDLDSTCAQLDAQIGVNLETRDALGIEDLVRVAHAQHLVERGSNRYARLGESGSTLFSLAFADAPNRLTLLLDVPRCPEVLKPWDQLVDCARACAALLEARVVDDNGRPLGEPAIMRIAEQLGQRYRTLESAGFPAGSPLAMRLFN